MATQYSPMFLGQLGVLPLALRKFILKDSTTFSPALHKLDRKLSLNRNMKFGIFLSFLDLKWVIFLLLGICLLSICNFVHWSIVGFSYSVITNLA